VATVILNRGTVADIMPVHSPFHWNRPGREQRRPWCLRCPHNQQEWGRQSSALCQ